MLIEYWVELGSHEELGLDGSKGALRLGHEDN